MKGDGAETQLFQSLLTTVDTLLYAPTVSNNGQVKIPTLFIANRDTGSSGVRVTLYNVPVGGTPGNDNVIFPETLMPNRTLWLPFNAALYIKQGGTIWGKANVDGVVCVTANGTVFSG